MHEPNHFWRSLRFVSQKSNLDTIPVNRVFLISTRRSPPEKSLYFVFQRGSGFRWQTDGSGDGQQHCHAVRHDFAKGVLQTFNEPGRNLIKPQRGLAALPWPVPRRLRVVMSTATRFPATMIQASGGSLRFSHVAENRLATASMAVRSCFFKYLMGPYPWPATCAAFRAATWDLIAPHLQL